MNQIDFVPTSNCYFAPQLPEGVKPPTPSKTENNARSSSPATTGTKADKGNQKTPASPPCTSDPIQPGEKKIDFGKNSLL